MAVKFTKPEINVREKLAELDKPSGIAGEAMLRAETPQEQQALIGMSGRRNLLINGGFDVWQRATSNTTNSGYRSVDRWQFNTYTGGAFTISKETDSTFGNVLKWNRTTADTSNTNAGNCIQQIIENAKYVIKGQPVTVSFWLKNEKTVLRSGFVRFRISGSPHTLLSPAQYWESGSNEWEYHSFTFQTSDTVALDHVDFQIQLDNGSSMGAIYIAQCQFELGKVATPFEHRSYGEELALCQRYFIRYNGNIELQGQSYAPTSHDSTIYLPVSMRVGPTVTTKDVQNNVNKASIYQGGAYTHNVSTAKNTGRTRDNVIMMRSDGALTPTAVRDNACQVQFNDFQADAEL